MIEYLISNLSWAAPLILITWALGYIIYQRTLSPFASIPGPFLASISRLWMIKHSLKGDMHSTMLALHNKLGPLVRTGPNEVSVSDLTAIKTIYGAGSRFRKSDWYAVWQGKQTFNLFAERDEKIHGAQRRLLSRPFSMQAMKELEPYVDEDVKVFMQQMDQRLGQVVDMGKWTQLFAFDVIGEITFSKRFGFMDSGEDYGTFEKIDRALRSAAWVGQIPSFFWAHHHLTPLIGNHLGIASRDITLRDFAVKEVVSRKDRGTDHTDMLSQLLATQKEKPDQMDDNAVISTAFSNIFAGSDTTAISTRAIIYFLLKNPACRQRFVEEVDDLWRQGKLSNPVTLEQAEQMPYLQAVMYEALRLHPAVGMSLPRVVPEGGVTVAGKYLPAGSVVGVNPWVVHRNQEVFGDDCEAFRPERWMKEDSGDMHRFFFAFGGGSRTCIGRNISWMEMSKLIPTLFLNYTMELTEPDAEWRVSSYWFTQQHDFNLRLKRRN